MNAGTLMCKAHVEGGRPLALAVIFDHIFPDIEIPCSRFFIRNIERIAALVDDGKVPADKAVCVSKIRDRCIEYACEVPTMKASASSRRFTVQVTLSKPWLQTCASRRRHRRAT
jgi:hypothetical protein